MSWSFVVPGQPPSTNHAYRDVIIRRKNGGTYRRRAKTPEAEAYQVAATLCCRAAKPKGWTPNEQIRVTLDLHLRHRQDSDNSQKMLLDAVAVGLGVDDDCFLPCVRSKVHGVKDPYVEVTIE